MASAAATALFTIVRFLKNDTVNPIARKNISRHAPISSMRCRPLVFVLDPLAASAERSCRITWLNSLLTNTHCGTRLLPTYCCCGCAAAPGRIA